MREASRRLPDAICALACFATLALLLFAAGRPVATDDLWWHVALGRTFAHEGPWLEEDPLLFAAPRPAPSASWLADVALAGLYEGGGFTGLRVGGAAVAAALAVLAAWLLWRESRSLAVTCIALIAFLTLVAYRAFQLRPEFATLFATLLLYHFALRPRAGPTPLAIALCAGMMALWANLHAAFLLGPLCVATAALGVLGALLVGGRRPTPPERTRIARLGALLLVGSLATLANPAGFEQHARYFVAGTQSPDLGAVRDEWVPLHLFALPDATPPSLGGWLLIWGLLLATSALTLRAIGAWRRPESAAGPDEPPDAGDLDPALVALAWLGLAAALGAIRFLWLGVFALLLCARACRDARPRVPAAALAWLSALAAAALATAFVWIGPWPRIGEGTTGYRAPYSSWKYYAEPIFLLRDAGLEGRLFTEYHVGGFAGFWLAPKVKTYINGSLNSPPGAVQLLNAIWARRGQDPDESFEALLDRIGVDLFHGTQALVRGSASSNTLLYLERTPGWKSIFRNVRSALYLRDDARNAENLRRVASYYARSGVPFDPAVGFDPARVLREKPDWAIRQGLAPADFGELLSRSADASSGSKRIPAMGLVANWYALLGLYDAAIEIDTEILARAPRQAGPRRRLVWSLLQAGRVTEADREARSLLASDDLSQRTAEIARRCAAQASANGGHLGPDALGWIKSTPLLTEAQGAFVEYAIGEAQDGNRAVPLPGVPSR